MRWAWALLLAAGARGAEIRTVIEDFATTTGSVGKGRFHDVCCGRGESVAGISFCELAPDEPGKSDTVYREFERTAFDAIIDDLPALEIYVPSSPFLSRRMIRFC